MPPIESRSEAAPSCRKSQNSAGRNGISGAERSNSVSFDLEEKSLSILLGFIPSLFHNASNDHRPRTAPLLCSHGPLHTSMSFQLGRLKAAGRSRNGKCGVGVKGLEALTYFCFGFADHAWTWVRICLEVRERFADSGLAFCWDYAERGGKRYA
jgi:hypothetical protein